MDKFIVCIYIMGGVLQRGNPSLQDITKNKKGETKDLITVLGKYPPLHRSDSGLFMYPLGPPFSILKDGVLGLLF